MNFEKQTSKMKLKKTSFEKRISKKHFHKGNFEKRTDKDFSEFVGYSTLLNFACRLFIFF